VNPPEAHRRDCDKLRQLQAAARVGLTIPPSLLSNEPAEIAAFYDSCAGEVIYKPFKPGRWLSATGRPTVSFTADVPASLLQERSALASAPGIYQEKMPKRDEWRITVFGRSCFAVRIDSQKEQKSAMDWRAGQQTIDMVPAEVPDWLARACFRFNDALRLRFASFDFVRMPDDSFVFLEANQAGQFLWKEVQDPAFPLLAAFTDFLLSRDPQYEWRGEPSWPRFGDFEETPEYEEIRAAAEAAGARRNAERRAQQPG